MNPQANELKHQKESASLRATAKITPCISLNTDISPQMILFGMATPQLSAVSRAIREAVRNFKFDNRRMK